MRAETRLTTEEGCENLTLFRLRTASCPCCTSRLLAKQQYHDLCRLKSKNTTLFTLFTTNTEIQDITTVLVTWLR